MRIVPYIKQSVRTHVGDEACADAFLQMQLESMDDRLGDNYKYHRLNLDKMYNFNFVFDGDEPVQASGCQTLSDDVVRVFSRYYVFEDYRTDSSNPLDKTDDFAELKYAMETLSAFPLIIWTRDKGSGFFKRLKRGRPDLFSEWEVYPEQIELMHKDREADPPAPENGIVGIITAKQSRSDSRDRAPADPEVGSPAQSRARDRGAFEMASRWHGSKPQPFDRCGFCSDRVGARGVRRTGQRRRRRATQGVSSQVGRDRAEC